MDVHKRFKILLRDNFTCQYCGRSSPEVVLEIDHVIPRAKGGTEGYDNLVTACRDCNKGKADLDILPVKENFLKCLQKYDEEIISYVNDCKSSIFIVPRMVEKVKHLKVKRLKYVIDYLENHDGDLTEDDFLWKYKTESVDAYRYRFLNTIKRQLRDECNALLYLTDPDKIIKF